MRYRKLGSSELLISEIGFGSWLTFTDPQRTQIAISCVHRALDLGINFLDTANVYGRGAAETVLGKALTGVKRETYVLATKLFFPMTNADRGLSREQVHKQLDASLKRLKVDYVDLYQCHRYDFDTPLEETMEALTQAVASEKVRYVGFSEWPLERIEAAMELKNVVRFVSSQPQYSLLHREPENGLLSLSEKSGISQVVWSPLAQGVLTGKYLPNSPVPEQSCGGPFNGRVPKSALVDTGDSRGGAKGETARGQCEPHPGPIRARVGSETAERQFGDCRGIASRAGER
jgi:aryl-alcohol dehydrogenase-like predicted oxidoreductase